MNILYFSGDNCNVCKSLYPKIDNLIRTKFKKITIKKYKTKEDNDIFIKYQVMSIPTVILVIDNKEFIRKVRNFSIIELEKEIDRIYKLYY